MTDCPYVLATKYCDGDPGDHYAVGWHAETYDHFGSQRHIVLDGKGKAFRANGFRKIEPITEEEGMWMIEHFHCMRGFEFIEDEHGEEVLAGWSVWDWLAYKRNGRMLGHLEQKP